VSNLQLTFHEGGGKKFVDAYIQK